MRYLIIIGLMAIILSSGCIIKVETKEVPYLVETCKLTTMCINSKTEIRNFTKTFQCKQFGSIFVLCDIKVKYNDPTPDPSNSATCIFIEENMTTTCTYEDLFTECIESVPAFNCGNNHDLWFKEGTPEYAIIESILGGL